MNIEDFREFCLSLPAAHEKAPFSKPEYQNLITFTVGDKWFILLDLDKKACNIKADLETITRAQEKYTGAVNAWHMNKKHWLGIMLNSDIPDSEIKHLVTNGYNLIVKKLTKATRTALNLT